MKIGNNEYFYEINRQKYVMLLKDSQEIKVIEETHLKKVLAAEFRKTERAKTLLAGEDKESFYKESDKYERRGIKNVELVNLEFAPHKPAHFDKNGFQVVNTYVPTDILAKSLKKRAKSDLSALHSDIKFVEKYPHISRLLSNLFVTEDRLSYFINWLSCAIVTRDKNRTAIVLKGIQGAGKGVLWEQIIEYIIGNAYCVMITNDDFGKFNEQMENVLFVLANEIKGIFTEGNVAYEKMKIWITDTEIRIEFKHGKTIKVRNYFNMLISSNNATPIQIQGNDRRYTVYETSSKTLKAVAETEFNMTIEQFIAKIVEERDEFISDLLMFNFDKDLAGTAQWTAEKERIYRSSMTKVEILADKIKGVDRSFFENDFSEIAESIDEDDFFEVIRKCEVPIITTKVDGVEEKSVSLTVEYMVNSMFDEISSFGYISNSTLRAVYEIFTGEKSVHKLGNSLSAHFGQAISERHPLKDKKVVKVRKVDLYDSAIQKITEEENPFA